MTPCTVPISEIEVQLNNLIITTSAILRLNKGGITIEIVAEDCEYHFQFSLVDKKIQLIRRKFSDGGVAVSSETLHDFGTLDL